MLTKEERRQILNRLAARIDLWKSYDLLAYAYDRYYEELAQMNDPELELEFNSAVMSGEVEDCPWLPGNGRELSDG